MRDGLLATMALLMVAMWAALSGCSCKSAGVTPGQAGPRGMAKGSPGQERPGSDRIEDVEDGGAIGRIDAWRPLFQGVDIAEGQAASPRPMRAYSVRVDLEDPAIEFLVTPSNGEKPLDTDSQTTSDFLKAVGCQVAINASAFEPFDPQSATTGVPENVLGLSISRGECYSADQPGHSALLISKDKKVWVARPGMALSDAYNAVAGFGVVLEDGKNCGAEDPIHPRTAAGVSRDGRYLILMVIDGRQLGTSLGATTQETGEWMKAFGAHNAVNLDGGGSATLAISDGRGGSRVLNRPIHMGIPGRERPVANHLGVFARPLMGGTP